MLMVLLYIHVKRHCYDDSACVRYWWWLGSLPFGHSFSLTPPSIILLGWLFEQYRSRLKPEAHQSSRYQNYSSKTCLWQCQQQDNRLGHQCSRRWVWIHQKKLRKSESNRQLFAQLLPTARPRSLASCKFCRPDVQRTIFSAVHRCWYNQWNRGYNSITFVHPAIGRIALPHHPLHWIRQETGSATPRWCAHLSRMGRSPELAPTRPCPHANWN